MSLLCFLAKHPGQVHSRIDLANKVWPNVVVGDEAINRAIFALRNALGDDAKKPQYIETIPKKGYRFLAEVHEENTTSHSFGGGKALTAILLLALISITTLFLFNYFTQTPHLKIDKILPVTHSPGGERGMVVHSPTQQMLYVHQALHSRDLYLYDLTRNISTRLTNDAWYERSPIWLDASTWLYVRCNTSGCEIVRQSLDTQPEILYHANNKILGLAFSEHHKNVLYFSQYLNAEHVELNSLNVLSGKIERQQKRYPTLPKTVYNPVLSAKGEHLYFYTIKADRPILMMLDFSKKTVTTISEAYENINHLSLSPIDGQLLLAAKQDANQGLWSQTLMGDAKLLLRSSGGEEIHSVISDRDHNTIYYENFRDDFDLILASLTTGEIDELPSLNGKASEYWGQFDQTQENIIFSSNRSGFSELWRYNIKTQNVEQITELQALNISTFAFSSSGQWLAVSYNTDHLQLALIDLHTGKTTKNIAIPHRMFPLAWSQDDKSIYISEHQTSVNLYVYDRKTLTAKPIRMNAGLFAQESADGENLLYIDYAKKALIERNLSSDQETIRSREISDLPTFFPGQIVLRKNNIVTINKEAGKLSLRHYPLSPFHPSAYNTDTREKYSNLDKIPLHSAWVSNLSPDLKSALIIKRRTPTGGVMKIELKH